MAQYDISDAQWCVLDLLMRAKELGVSRLSRTEMLNNQSIPDSAKLKLTWGALTMPKDIVVWHGEHEFEITDAGVSLYRLRFDTVVPTHVGDAVIFLPDHTMRN